MSSFKVLREVSNNFENQLNQLSTQLCTAKVGESFEDALAKKLRDVSILSAKLKLLRAKPLSLTPQIKDQPQDNTLEEYGEEVACKVLEQMTVKSITLNNSVKALITASNSTLDPELVERKKAIIESLCYYHNNEQNLAYLDTHLKEKEAEHAALRAEWDRILGALRDIKECHNQEEINDRGPLYPKLSMLVNKLEIIRWLIGRLVCARGNYDWLADPHGRLTSALALTRAHNTVELFTQD